MGEFIVTDGPITLGYEGANSTGPRTRPVRRTPPPITPTRSWPGAWIGSKTAQGIVLTSPTNRMTNLRPGHPRTCDLPRCDTQGSALPLGDGRFGLATARAPRMQ